ncbi:TetR/AcrR family transcriptional regulator [Kribbella sandramycini]|uniref:AcrR family transcriptional regulator n=1 Tax=Kribbella sandramycini TaxID=60450 RepID=A0A7Y4KYE5_9ACTN|nr:TetR/AcrR family transcriptional regulator [Kribbella sandramycini]MBB6567265.1 AcrR family transcriptional regulator [Kribbella sandramycini]NOL40121.1 TetR/AcrR family transcriptional regulator [Kribbella sandramycini]
MTKTSAARTRLLDTATQVFYAEGLHAVGIDRIVAEAQVTRATLYRHFPSKDDLVVAYLESVSQLERGQVGAAVGTGRAPADTIRLIAESIAQGLSSPVFRGCAFLNAAAEYPNPEHPVHQAVLTHRHWFETTITNLFTQLGAPTSTARQFILLRDGAMAAGCLTNPTTVGQTLLEAVDALLAKSVEDQGEHSG